MLEYRRFDKQQARMDKMQDITDSMNDSLRTLLQKFDGHKDTRGLQKKDKGESKREVGGEGGEKGSAEIKDKKVALLVMILVYIVFRDRREHRWKAREERRAKRWKWGMGCNLM